MAYILMRNFTFVMVSFHHGNSISWTKPEDIRFIYTTFTRRQRHLPLKILVHFESLNRIRTKYSRCKDVLLKWGYSNGNYHCECTAPQNITLILSCPACPYSHTCEDLLNASENAVRVAEYWSILIPKGTQIVKLSIREQEEDSIIYFCKTTYTL